MTVFNPFDNTWWKAGTQLNWWEHDPTLPQPAWVPDPIWACDWLTQPRRRQLTLTTLAVIHSQRTIETQQLHRFAPYSPQNANSMLYRAMYAANLIDLGYPLSTPTGRVSTNPDSAPWMAVRLPRRTDITSMLTRLGYTPIEILSLGPTPLRGRRQYDRHNLITNETAISARQHGWLVYGEAWGRFDMLTHDPLISKPGGGPDCQLVGETMTVCVETTASMNNGFQQDKIHQWERILHHPNSSRLHVVWLDADRDHMLVKQLEYLTGSEPRQHAATVEEFNTTFTTRDGWTAQPGHPQQPTDWMQPVLQDVAARLMTGGDSTGWRLPPRLRGQYPILQAQHPTSEPDDGDAPPTGSHQAA